MNSAPSDPPPVIPEVLPPETPVPPYGEPGQDARRSRGDGSRAFAAPYHPLAAVLLLLIDNLWNLADWAALLWVITVPLSFLTVALPTLIVQRSKHGDSWGKALLKAAFLGLLAAIPTSITGTPVGLLLLAWAGIKRPGN